MMTVAQAAEKMQVSQSLLYRLIKNEEIDHYQIGKAGIRLNWESHIMPYLERAQRKKPRPQRLTGKKATLKHLDLS